MIKYEEIAAEKACDVSPHNHLFINPYNGCSMGCPFCYWLLFENWENRIQIKTNIAELLEAELKDWPKGDYCYLGSVCDPYNELEEKYQLTRKCLEIIKNHDIPLLITTSASNSTVLRDLDLLEHMKVIVVVELARIPLVETMLNGGSHTGIANANALAEAGLTVYSTLAPLCPGVIELEPILERLNQRIPVYVDSLKCEKGGLLAERTLQWIHDCYPDRVEEYNRIINLQDSKYFEEILEYYNDNQRIKKFPYELR